MAFVPAAESTFKNHEDGHLPSDLQAVLMRRSTSYPGLDRAEESQPDEEMSDDGCQLLGEKKRRLNLEQVEALEKSFELGNKLEPERKMQLARALGLQPRQIAIWFQNRRARCKTKKLEKDYGILKRQFDSLKADNDALKSQNKKLQSQLVALKSKVSVGPGIMINLNKENECSWSDGSTEENSRDFNLNTTSTDNKIYHQQNDKHPVVFPSPGAAGFTFQGPNGPFCNTFSGVEDNQDFWPWPEQQNFHL